MDNITILLTEFELLDNLLCYQHWRSCITNIINLNNNFVETITKGIDKAAKEGYVLAFLTENGIKSEWVLREIMYAIKRGGQIILIASGPMPDNIEFLLHNYNNRIDIQNMSVSEASYYIVDTLLRIDSKNNQ